MNKIIFLINKIQFIYRKYFGGNLRKYIYIVIRSYNKLSLNNKIK